MWWPIDTNEHRGQSCGKCGSKVGLSRDDKGRVFCPEHRGEHDK